MQTVDLGGTVLSLAQISRNVAMRPEFDGEGEYAIDAPQFVAAGAMKRTTSPYPDVKDFGYHAFIVRAGDGNA